MTIDHLERLALALPAGEPLGLTRREIRSFSRWSRFLADSYVQEALAGTLQWYGHRIVVIPPNWRWA